MCESVYNLKHKIRIQWRIAMNANITLIVNGQKRTVVTDPERPLLDVLR